MEMPWERFGVKRSDWIGSMYQGIVALIAVARSDAQRDGISYEDFTRLITACTLNLIAQ